MSARIIFGFVALTGCSVCGFVTTLFHSQLVERVNERLPAQKQFSPLWWYASKTQRLHAEYLNGYPEGTLILKKRTWFAAAVVCLLCCAWALGFFGF
jgi:hypothetical protein